MEQPFPNPPKASYDSEAIGELPTGPDRNVKKWKCDQGSKYSYSYQACLDALGSSKYSTYGTVIYKPKDFRVDFGKSCWPPAFEKKIVCPRILLISSWTDARLGFIGGNNKRSETPIQTINREFMEEMGTPIEFSVSDFCFATMDHRCTFFFAVTTDDLSFFENLLISFQSSTRQALVDEVLSATGYPLWMEGPEKLEEVTFENNVWGLPRHLVGQGGFLTPTLSNSNIVRENFLALLLISGLLSLESLQRLFLLAASAAIPAPLPLPALEDFLETIGVSVGDHLTTKVEIGLGNGEIA